MTKGVRTTLILFIVLSALVAFVIYSNNADAERAAATPAPSLYLWDITTEDIASVHLIDHTAKAEVTLSRAETEGWQVKARATGGAVVPLQPAVSAQGDLAASMLSTLFIQRTLTETTEIAEFGLQPALYTVNLTTVDGLNLAMDVGTKTPSQDAYYVLRAGDVNATIVNAGSIDPLLALISAPPVVAPPEPEVIPTGEGTPAPEGTESATAEP